MPALTGYAPTDRLIQMYLGGGAQTGVAAPNAVPSTSPTLPAAGQRPTSGRYAGMSANDILAMMGSHGYTQEGVNAVYAMRNLGAPPTVPPSLEAAGAHPGAGRAATAWIGSDGKPIKTANIPDIAPWRDFTNTLGRTAIDPFKHYDVGNWLGVAGMLAGGYGAGSAIAGGGAAAGGASGSTGGGLGIFSNGGAAGLAGVGGGNAGALAAAGGIAGGAGVGGTTAGALGGFSGIANTVSGVGMPGASGSWLDWIGPAITAGSALYGQHQANNATDAATRAANAEQSRQFDLVRGDTAPIRALGAAAVGRLGALQGYTSDTGTPDMSQFYTSPDYQFRLGEGQKAIDNSAAARGGLLSGAAVKEGIRFNSGTASGEYGAFIDRLMQQAGLGSNGTAQSAAAGANSANNISANTINAGNARASGYMDTAANVSNAANTGVQNMMLRRYLGG